MTTPKFALAELTPGGGQPHLTLNEGLKLIDSIATRATYSVLTISAPPDPDLAGRVHIIGPNPTGEWVGKYAWLAIWLNVGHWVYVEPKLGMMMYDVGNGLLVVFTGFSSFADPWQYLGS